MSDPLWLTTPVGTIAKAMERWKTALKSHAEQAVDDFLYDLSADGPVLVLNGETYRVKQEICGPFVTPVVDTIVYVVVEEA